MRILSEYLDDGLSNQPKVPNPFLPGNVIVLQIMDHSVDPRRLYASVSAVGGYEAVNQLPEGWRKIAEMVGVSVTGGSAARPPALEVRSAYEAKLLRYERLERAVRAIAAPTANTTAEKRVGGVQS
jgi:hypothetical protein